MVDAMRASYAAARDILAGGWSADRWLVRRAAAGESGAGIGGARPLALEIVNRPGQTSPATVFAHSTTIYSHGPSPAAGGDGWRQCPEVLDPEPPETRLWKILLRRAHHEGGEFCRPALGRPGISTGHGSTPSNIMQDRITRARLAGDPTRSVDLAARRSKSVGSTFTAPTT